MTVQRKGFVIQSIDDSYTFKSTNKFSLIIKSPETINAL